MTAIFGEPQPANTPVQATPPRIAGAVLILPSAVVSAVPCAMVGVGYFTAEGIVSGMAVGDPPASTLAPLLLFSAIGFGAAGWLIFRMPVWAATVFGLCLSPILPPVLVSWDPRPAVIMALTLACMSVTGFITRRMLNLPLWISALAAVSVPILVAPLAAGLVSSVAAM
jgi:hypothetical protein